MSKLVDGSILVTNGLIKAFDVAFLMVQQLVCVGMLHYDPETPGVVCQWIVSVARDFFNGIRDLDCGILEEELS